MINELKHWHPHLHVLITYGAWTAEGEFLKNKEMINEKWKLKSAK